MLFWPFLEPQAEKASGWFIWPFQRENLGKPKKPTKNKEKLRKKLGRPKKGKIRKLGKTKAKSV